MIDDFTADPKIQRIAEAYALDALAFAREGFGLELDWSDDSIAKIEDLLGVLHDQVALLSKEQVLQFATMLGSYVGEVFRRNHGAAWGMVTLQRQSFPGLMASQSSGTFWLWARARSRIVDGPSDNMWHYYQVLIEEHGVPGDRPVLGTAASKKSWWGRLAGG